MLLSFFVVVGRWFSLKRNSFPVMNLAYTPDSNGAAVTRRHQYGITGLDQFRKQFL